MQPEARAGGRSRRPGRVRAPELVGRGGWLNTAGHRLALADLRGRVVVLDFWTFCCVNCLHVLAELRPLEAAYPDVLVVIGVHSPKFAHEADHAALAAAVDRYEVAHPVLDDPELRTWRQYAVRAWPTLVVIDPEGYVVAEFSGEGHGPALAALIADLVAEHERRGTLRRSSPGRSQPAGSRPDGSRQEEEHGSRSARGLTFPSKVAVLPDGDLLVSDTGGHGLVQQTVDGRVRRRIGGPQRGLVDGPGRLARFAEPGGVAVLPASVAADAGVDLVVADTANHALRGIRLAASGADRTPAEGDDTVLTLAGTGRPWRSTDPIAGPGPTVPLSSPWDCVWWPAIDRVVVAMAGTHQLWTYDPRAGTVGVLAGTTQEGLVDGAPERAWFAQPSGLAVSPDGQTLWLVDAETSALRRVGRHLVHTEVGQGLFDFGHLDGPASTALLQHPLGLAVLPAGCVVVADTYNGALRQLDLATGAVTTLATGLAEPTDVAVLPASAGAGSPDQVVLAVAESAAHRVRLLRLPDHPVPMAGTAHRTRRPAADLAPGPVDLVVAFEPPAGQSLDDRYGPATHLAVSATPADLLVSGAGRGPQLHRRLVVADPSSSGAGEGVLHVSVRVASCDVAGAAEFPACHVHQQDWGVPVRLVPGGPDRLDLVLSGRLDAEGPQ